MMNVATESITCFSDEHHKGLRQKLSAAYYINKKKTPGMDSWSLPQSHRFVNAFPAKTVQAFHDSSCLLDNACSSSS